MFSLSVQVKQCIKWIEVKNIVEKIWVVIKLLFCIIVYDSLRDLHMCLFLDLRILINCSLISM